MCAIPGSRHGPPPTSSWPQSPFSVASGTASSHLAHQLVAQPGQLRGAVRTVGDPRAGRPPRGPTTAGTLSVPDRTSRLLAAARAAAACTPRRGAAAAHPGRRGRRACARSGSVRPAPQAAKSTGSTPTACTASVCSGTSNSWRDLAQRLDVVDRADLVVRPHHADQRGPAGAGGGARRAASPGGPGRPGRPAAAPARRPSWVTNHSAASSTAWCSMADTSSRVRRGVVAPASPVDALHREVVALGAAGG